MILAPVVVNRKGEQLELFVELRAKGFVRVRVDGTVHEIDAVPRLAKNIEAHDRGRRRSAARARRHEAAARRIVRDGAAQRRRPRDRRRDGHERGRGASVLGEVRLPDLQLLARRARAAALLVQQSDGRVPALRRPRQHQLLRSEARRRVSAALARLRRDQGLGPPQPVLLPDAREPREARRLRSRAAVRAAAGARAADPAVRQRRREDSVHVPVRPRQADDARARVRGHHPEPRAPLPRDRLADGARGAREVPELEALPRVRRHAAAARGALRQGRHGRRRARDLRGLGDAAARCRRALREDGPRRPEGGDRRPDHQGDREPARVPQQRRASTISRSTARRRRSPAASRSGSGSRRRSARG